MRAARPLFTILPALALAACEAQPQPVSGTYRIDHISLPTSADEASLALNQDRDGRVDDATSALVADLETEYDDLATSVPAGWDTALSGDTAWLVVIAPDGQVRLTGDGGTVGIPAHGSNQDGQVTSLGGHGSAPLGMLADLAATGATDWNGAFFGVDLTDLGNGQLDGVIGGALSPGYRDLLAAGLLPYLQQRLDAGMTDWGASMDKDHDGTLTTAEILSDTFFVALTNPDLDVTPADGAAESLSFGFHVHATEVPSCDTGC